MRSEPKPVEIASINALLEAFRKEGHNAERIPRDVEDKPDGLLQFQNCRIACECIQIPPEYIFKYMHTRIPLQDFQGINLVSRTWPFEPHEWVARAILKKAQFVDEYIKRTDAQHAWLIVHAPIEHNQNFIDSKRDWIRQAVVHGTLMHKHPFEQVFLWTPQDGILSIYVRRHGENRISDFALGFSNGYPTITTHRLSFGYVTPPLGAKLPLQFRHAAKVIKHTYVDPLDATYLKYKPAYRPIEAVVTGEIWPTRCRFKVDIHYPLENKTEEGLMTGADNLVPDSQNYMHYLYESTAPRRLETLHVTNKPDASS